MVITLAGLWKCDIVNQSGLPIFVFQPSSSTPKRLSVFFQLECSWPQVLCIPDSSSHGVDLKSPPVLFARASGKGHSLRLHCGARFNLLLCPCWPEGYCMNYLMLICLMACHCSGPLLKLFLFLITWEDWQSDCTLEFAFSKKSTTSKGLVVFPLVGGNIAVI